VAANGYLQTVIILLVTTLSVEYTTITQLVICYSAVPSVLWCCWLGCRKGIQHGYVSGSRCRSACCPMSSWFHCHSLDLLLQ